MGVPVVAKKGDYFLSHLGETIAHNANLSNWLADNNEEYVKLAMHFSSDLDGLAKLRGNLREQLLETPLFDLPRFANHFERALWSIKQKILTN